jgi:hypothetical protein
MYPLSFSVRLDTIAFTKLAALILRMGAFLIINYAEKATLKKQADIQD